MIIHFGGILYIYKKWIIKVFILILNTQLFNLQIKKEIINFNAYFVKLA